MTVTTTSRAAALRWLAARVGQDIDTVQVRPSGIEWWPGPRTLARSGNTYELEGSSVRFGANHVIHEAGARLVAEWLDDDGVTIHTTIYTDVTDDTDEEDA